jgi:hypothetical protein
MSAALAVLPFLWASETAPRPRAPKLASARRAKPVAKVEAHVAFYRKYTEGMLRRYTKCFMEAGRTPSMLGREMFRAKVTSYTMHGFDDLVIFVHDVERCVGRLDRMDQMLIKRIAVQEYTQDETAEMMGLPRTTVVRHYEEAVDRLTRIFLERRLLEPRLECQVDRAGC